MKPHASAGGGFASVHARFTYADTDEIDFESLARANYDERQRERGRRSFVMRAQDEQRSLLAFSRLLSELCEAGAPIDVIGTATRIVRDEARHVELCGRVVDALGGWPSRVPEPGWVRIDPKLPLATRIQRAVVGSLCIGETISVAMLAGVRAHATDPVVHAVLTQMLADESLHSRFGWWWLAREHEALREQDRAALESWLPFVFAGLASSLRPNASALAASDAFDHGAFGALSPRERDTVFMICMQETIVPGLERAGIGAGAAWHSTLAAMKGSA